ncbi:MAG: hypothetical protein IMZ52_10240 [Actinobacteria bacterium]|nr:hypothetical protein [Actinomycetota bacterium]
MKAKEKQQEPLGVPTYGIMPAAVTSSWEWNMVTGNYVHNMLRLGTSEYYMQAYTNPGTDPTINTTRVWNDNGTIRQANIDSLSVSTYGTYPTLVHISGDYYAVAYTGGSDTVVIKTFVADDANGLIGAAALDTLATTTTTFNLGQMKQLSDKMFILVDQNYSGTGGGIRTFYCTNVGIMPATFNDTVWFNKTACTYCDVEIVDSNTVIIAYQGSGSDGYLVTYDINAVTGDITNTWTSEWEYDTSRAMYPDIKKVTGNVYCIAYYDTNSDLQIKTLTIATDGTITKSFIDTLNIPGVAPTGGLYPTLFTVNNLSVYGVTYSAYNDDNDGYVSTFAMDSTGAIGAAEIDRLEFDAADNIFWAPIVWVNQSWYYIAYTGTGRDGWSCTVSITTNYASPTFSNPSPTNNSVDQALTPQTAIIINDLNGDNMNLYWYENSTGSYVCRQVNSSCANGTYYWTFDEATSYSLKYYWKVFANDTTHNVSTWYCFTTEAPPAQKNWYTTNEYNGSLYVSPSFNSIGSEYNGSLYVSPSFEQIGSEYNGSLYVESSYNLISEINGSLDTSLTWNLLTEWQKCYLYVDSSWKSVNDWNGSLYVSPSFNSIEEWNGSLYTSSTWNAINTWNGSLYVSPSFNTVNDWNGSLYVSPLFNTVNDWNGSLYVSPSWTETAEWNGSLYTTPSWHTASEWNGSLYYSTTWSNINEWNGSLYAYSSWRSTSDWNGSLYTVPSYHSIADWNGSLYVSPAFNAINEWNGSLYVSPSFNAVNDWNGSLYTSVSWNSVNEWNGSLYTIPSWSVSSEWNGSLYVSQSFNTINDWNGSLYTVSSWHSTSDWNGSLYVAPSFNSISTWNGSLYVSPSYHVVNEWNGSLYTTPGWTKTNEWNGSLYVSPSFNTINEWNGSLYASTAWNTVNNWNGSLYTTTTWHATEWNGSLYTYGYYPDNITISDPHPSNNSIHIRINITLSITVTDMLGYNMNITWYWGNSSSNATQYLGSTLNVGNGTYYMHIQPANGTFTDYWWNVTVNDGHENYANATYDFVSSVKSGGIIVSDRKLILGLCIGIILIFPIIIVIKSKRKNEDTND